MTRGVALLRSKDRSARRRCDQHERAQDNSARRREPVARLCDALSNAERPAEKTNFSKAEVLKMLDLPEMQNLLRQKRLRWVGHALRRKDGDLSNGGHGEAGACTQAEPL